MLVAWKRQSRVDDDDRAAAVVRGQVLPDLAQAAERDDAAPFVHLVSLGGRARVSTGPAGAPRLGGGRFQHPEPLEAAADARELLVGCLDEREAQPTDLLGEQVERALDRDR